MAKNIGSALYSREISGKQRKLQDETAWILRESRRWTLKQFLSNPFLDRLKDRYPEDILPSNFYLLFTYIYYLVFSFLEMMPRDAAEFYQLLHAMPKSFYEPLEKILRRNNFDLETNEIMFINFLVEKIIEATRRYADQKEIEYLLPWDVQAAISLDPTLYHIVPNVLPGDRRLPVEIKILGIDKKLRFMATFEQILGMLTFEVLQDENVFSISMFGVDLGQENFISRSGDEFRFVRYRIRVPQDNYLEIFPVKVGFENPTEFFSGFEKAQDFLKAKKII